MTDSHLRLAYSGEPTELSFREQLTAELARELVLNPPAADAEVQAKRVRRRRGLLALVPRPFDAEPQFALPSEEDR